MSYPKTAEEWWKLVDDNWEAIVGILERFLPLHSLATDPPGKLNGKILMYTNLADILRAKKNKDGHKLCRYFNGAWNEAPDDPSIHNILGWDLLCDLCSEEHVLYEENNG